MALSSHSCYDSCRASQSTCTWLLTARPLSSGRTSPWCGVKKNVLIPLFCPRNFGATFSNPHPHPKSKITPRFEVYIQSHQYAKQGLVSSPGAAVQRVILPWQTSFLHQEELHRDPLPTALHRSEFSKPLLPSFPSVKSSFSPPSYPPAKNSS